MRPGRIAVWVCALALTATLQTPTQAAWHNVCEVCCENCKNNGSPAVSMASPVTDPCAPQQRCTTRYHQRAYYEPCTTTQQYTYYEPVTTYRTSYYYEPVCSYRYCC